VWPPATHADGDDGRKEAGARYAQRVRVMTEAAAKKVNKVCYECHMDFEDEELSSEHEEHGVTCVRCHGRSQPHMDDEVRKTPPDAIFRGASMKVLCLTCHDPAKHAREKMHASEAAAAKKTGRPERTCTTCHGEHELVDTEKFKKPPKKGK